MTTISYPCPNEQAGGDSARDETNGLFLPEIRRIPDTVTRACQGEVDVEPRRHAGWVPSVDGRPGNTILDSVVALFVHPPTDDDRADGLELRLLPGEARSLAAMLSRAADVVELNEGPLVADRNAFELGRDAERAGLFA